MSTQTREAVISTYSIVACDLEQREWGVGVQSKFLAVGAAVPYAEAEVGAIATQARANLAYGPNGLALLRNGLHAEEAVSTLVTGDDGSEHRQVGIVDSHGKAATYTGTACLAWAGGRTGDGYAAQGNILVSQATVDALAETYEHNAQLALAERLLAALAAAQAAGGDRRGQQAAALLVVRRGAGYGGASDRLVDLRVDDHPAPIAELQRLHRLHQVLFGATPEDEWIDVDETLREELRGRLKDLGYTHDDLEAAFVAWVATENLEERGRGVDRIDPVVLSELRRHH